MILTNTGKKTVHQLFLIFFKCVKKKMNSSLEMIINHKLFNLQHISIVIGITQLKHKDFKNESNCPDISR